MAEALGGGALFTLEGHRNGVRCVCFNPDGRRVASGSYDTKVQLWDTETGVCVLRHSRGTVFLEVLLLVRRREAWRVVELP